MSRLPAAVIIAFAWLSLAVAQLPCNSQLRLLPSFQHMFTHCGSSDGSNNGGGNDGGNDGGGDSSDGGTRCTTSEWSEWTEVDTRSVPISQCKSGKAKLEERTRKVKKGRQCDEQREERYLCKFRPVCCHTHTFAHAPTSTEL